MAAQDQAAPAGGADRALIDRAYSAAYKYEQTCGNCPQCVIAAVQDITGLVDDAVFKAGHALAGGGALTTQGTCGALVGALLAISSQFGRDKENFGRGRYLKNNQLAKQVFDRFVAEFGSPICAQVQTKVMGRAFDMWDADDFKAFEAAGGHVDKCPSVAGFAAGLAVEVLLEEKAKGNLR